MRLIVMRHATAGRLLGVPDRHRRLTPEGLAEAASVGHQLVARGWAPERILSSDALRTRETFGGLAQAFGEVPVEWAPSLYGAESDTLEEALVAEADATRSLLVLGHNPGLEDFVSRRQRTMVGFRPACAALLEHPVVPWSEAAFSSAWRLVDVLRPR